MSIKASSRKAYDYYVMNAYYPDHDEMCAIIGNRRGCTESAKDALMNGARYCEVAGCFVSPNSDVVEIVVETFSL